MDGILVVCIGNICRSPMAEGLLKRALPQKRIYSAGLGALIGKPADPIARQLMVEDGVDIGEHRAQQISTALVARAELVLVMDLEQKRHVETMYPIARGKVFRLCEASRQDVPDPYREGIDSFKNAQRLIAEGVQVWSEQIVRMG
ncbi:MAG: low molecular weight protein-tyrosine-phosphatase [Pseudomonadota bacterium]